jgi:hypothetical protein
MILKVTNAEYKGGYLVLLTFNNGVTLMVDLKNTIMDDHRKIFEPLHDINYFKNFEIRLNTIVWENEADFAPEFLLELGQKQAERVA